MSGHVLAIAHRAGNEAVRLHAAIAAGADIVEADIWPHRGRLEVRHLKTMGPVPLLWDRWQLASGWAARTLLSQLVTDLPPEIGLMLDLKGHNTVSAAEIADISAHLGFQQRLYVCARDWAMLKPFAAQGAVVVHSAGKPGELLKLAPILESGECTAVSVHQGLLDPGIVRRLRERVHLLMTWPVNDVARMRELVGWGVNGITTDSLAVVRAIRAAETAERPTFEPS
ncbi:MAG: glycerophosphodiester phosphodiesterase [Anaerolineaceae bacterium]